MSWSRATVKRGDVAVVSEERSTYVLGSGASARTEVRLYLVTSVTRDGRVKAVRALDSEAAHPVERLFGHPTVKTFPAEDVDLGALLAEAGAHKWPGHKDSSLLKPYDSVDEVRELVKRHMRQLATV
jgi:hypothetical protein